MSAPVTPAEAVLAAEAALAKARAQVANAASVLALAKRAQRAADDAAQAERERQERNRTTRDRHRARKVAAVWGVEIDRHDDLDSRPWYVSHPVLLDTEADPHEGDHYGFDWSDVAERVSEIAAVLEARGLTPDAAKAAGQ